MAKKQKKSLKFWQIGAVFGLFVSTFSIMGSSLPELYPFGNVLEIILSAVILGFIGWLLDKYLAKK